MHVSGRTPPISPRGPKATTNSEQTNKPSHPQDEPSLKSPQTSAKKAVLDGRFDVEEAPSPTEPEPALSGHEFLEKAQNGELTTEEITAFMKKNGGDINKTVDKEGNNALHLAAESGHTEVVKQIVEYGQTSLNILTLENKKGETPLELILLKPNLTSGHRIIAENLFRAGANKGSLNRTEIQWFIQKGLNIDTTDPHGNTALHLAAESGHTDVVSSLLEKGANVDLKTNDNKTPLDLVLGKAKKPTTRLTEGDRFIAINLFQKAAINRSLTNKQIRAFKTFINKDMKGEKRNKDMKGEKRNNALHLAAEFGHTEVVKQIIEYNSQSQASLNILTLENKDGDTPLELILRKSNLTEGDRFIAENLFRAGAEKGSLNRTEIHMFIQKGLNIHTEDKNGDTPLELILRKPNLTEGDEFIAKELFREAAKDGSLNRTQIQSFIQKELDIDTKDQYGKTPLYLAAKYGHTNVVSSLLEKGANVKTKDQYGKTPLKSAISGLMANPSSKGQIRTILIILNHFSKKGSKR